MGSGNTAGKMEEPMKGTGKKGKCMAKEYIPGKMAEGMKASIRMISSMAVASITGQMVRNFKVFG